MAEAGGGEVVGGGGDVEEAAPEMPLPEAIRGPRQRRRPPREEWIVNQGLYPQQPAAADPPGVPVEADGRQEPIRARRHAKPPDYLGIEKERGDFTDQQLDLSSTLTNQLLNLPPSLTERMLSPSVPTPTSSCSPTPPASVLTTPLTTPETSPNTSTATIAPPADLHSHTWLSYHGILHRSNPDDVLEASRHWSIGGGENEQGRPYPMLDWTPRTRRQSPSF